ncbi:MAG: glycosyltransferase family 4 protein [Acidobacteriota bacterium]
MTVIALFASALAASAALVGFLRRWAVRKAILDHPNERSSHDVPKPRGGGMAIVLITLAGSAYWMTPRAAVAAAAALVIAAVSFADDLRHLPATLRLAVQILAALAVALLFVPLVWVPLAVVWIVGLTNAYNFMDGIDGIAGGQAVVAGLAWGWLGTAAGQPLPAVIGLLIAGSSAGFLLHNWQPARIFMGDVGSAFLGFTFASLAVMAWPNLKLAAAGVLVVWPFVADAAFTFVRRARRRERLMEAHKSHVYQRLNQRGLSHAAVASIYIALAAAGAAAAIVYLERATG